MIGPPAPTSRILKASAAFIAVAILITTALAALAVTRAGRFSQTNDHREAANLDPAVANLDAAFLLRTVERRCVVCHGCYDAPCQFRMSSDEGISRGASKQPVYNPSRVSEAPLTRLGTDASTAAEWRKLGFYDVVRTNANADPAQSILWRMLALGRKHPIPKGAKLPRSVDLDITRGLSCPAAAEFDRYERDNPFGGMPYATAPLNDREWNTMSAWVTAGAPPFRTDRNGASALSRQVAEWEAFLNGGEPKMRLVARYIYEHLFLAHLYFSGSESSAYFQLVRSATPPGEPIRIIATRRPYDDPGTTAFHYRLSQVTDTILHKTHIAYEIGQRRLSRYRELFFNSDWTVTAPPSYEPTVASNPFAAFAAIPPGARYNFLLDDAEYFIRTFIRGPVCYGQVAVNVIEDRFWVMFLAPDADLSVTDPEYLAEATPYLGLPAEHVGGSIIERIVPAYLDHHRRYAEFRESRYNAADPEKLGPSINAIWAGESASGAALLTVFRHFDNATVIGGFYGDTPETAWVIDFPTFERIYYNLVAGFDVFGSLGHQISTRFYMDLLRIESEDLFLSFLPPNRRRALHADWYRGGHAKIRTVLHRRPIDVDYDTQIAFTGDDPKAELLLKVLERDKSGARPTDVINRAKDRGGELSPESATLSSIASMKGPWVQFMPELSLLQINHRSGPDKIYSLVHDKAHTNVAFLFAEDQRREPEKDTLTILARQLGSYPNFFFVVDEANLSRFTQSLMTVQSEEDWLSFVAEFGVRRSSRSFWETADFFQDAAIGQHPREGGLLDLSRYVDP